MLDIHSQKSNQKTAIAIDRVGVKGVRYPIVVLDKKKEHQATVATINMYANLPRGFRGTHMSRFIEVLNKYRGEISLQNIKSILAEIKNKLHASSANIEIEFPYFIEKTAPRSGAKSLMEYRCRFIGSQSDITGSDFILEVNVPVLSLCPCSKAISKKGAHNQRSIVTIQIRSKKLVWIEDLVRIAEESASSEVYTLLKRPDEKYITEYAYDHPVFVEDIVRNIAKKLKEISHIFWFKVDAENFESIHNHSAFASVLFERKTNIEIEEKKH